MAKVNATASQWIYPELNAKRPARVYGFVPLSEPKSQPLFLRQRFAISGRAPPKIHRELRAPEQSIRTIVRSYWSPMRLPDFEQTIKLFGITGAMGTFIWGVFVWRDKAIEDRAAIAREQKSVAITRKIEATRPFLEQQLAIYVDAIQTVETIASSQSQTEIGISTAHFWRLYWGELAIQALDELNRVEQAGPRGFWL